MSDIATSTNTLAERARRRVPNRQKQPFGFASAEHPRRHQQALEVDCLVEQYLGDDPDGVAAAAMNVVASSIRRR